MPETKITMEEFKYSVSRIGRADYMKVGECGSP